MVIGRNCLPSGLCLHVDVGPYWNLSLAANTQLLRLASAYETLAQPVGVGSPEDQGLLQREPAQPLVVRRVSTDRTQVLEDFSIVA